MEHEFKLRGKTVRIARDIRNIKLQEFADMLGFDNGYLSNLERENMTISRKNEIRIIRGLRKHLKVTDAELVAIQIILENAEGKFDE
ncbi:XRE family transcriptional regulator [Exiguobacterium sp. SH1S21]|uniref:helix-turn-helix domain-containing protein n=1 Tax=Exiguobacterium sp. SH1S21 TaxID=2510953 RepID=UPI00103CE621|nr:helix-turn-helix transcriptional regulator [Exiguobacterium sp. SH1S21]TCI50315.1 XRE family transcriptional regulator [Exiguobacterium sp. SH1S21]